MFKNKLSFVKLYACTHNQALGKIKTNVCIKLALSLILGLCTCLGGIANTTNSYATESIKADLYTYEKSAYKNSTTFRAPITQKIYAATPIKQDIVGIQQNMLTTQPLAVSLKSWSSFTAPAPAQGFVTMPTPRLTAAPSPRANHISWGSASGASNHSASDVNVTGNITFGAGQLTIQNTSHTINGSTLTVNNNNIQTTSGNIVLHGGYARADGNHNLSNNNVLISNGSTINGKHNTYRAGTASGNGDHALANNAIVIDGSNVTGNHSAGTSAFYGAHVTGDGNHALTGNSITIRNNSTIDTISSNRSTTYKGAFVDGKGNHNLIGNKLIIDGSTLKGKKILYGGEIDGEPGIGNHTLTDNHIMIKNSNLSDGNTTLMGSYVLGSGAHSVAGSTITLDKSNITGGTATIYNGMARSSGGGSHTITGSNLNIINGSMIDTTDVTFHNAYIAGTGNHSATNTNFNIDASTIKAQNAIQLFGAYGLSGVSHTISGNTINIANNSKITSATNAITILGGYTTGTSGNSITGNAITLDSNSSINANTYINLAAGHGNNTGNNMVSDNTVTITNSSKLAAATGDTSISGGSAIGAGIHTITGNKILVDNKATITAPTGSINLHGGSSNSDTSSAITGNTVTISNGSELSSINTGDVNIFGGHSEGANSTISGNSILIASGSKLSSTASGDINIIGGNATDTSGTHTITGNDITIDNASLIAPDTHINIIGGYSAGTDSSITGNTITIINDAKINSMGNKGDINIYGGYADGAGTHSVTNNTVIFDNLAPGSLDATGNITLAGGMITNGTGDAYSGNTLRINQITVDLTDHGTTHSTVKNFENYEFVLSPNREQITPMLLANEIQLGNDAGTKNANLKLKFTHGAQTLAVGSKFNIMQADTYTGTFANINTVDNTIDVTQGITMAYDFEAYVDDTSGSPTLYLELKSANLQEQTKIPAEAQAASLAFLNQGADLVSGLGMDSLRARTRPANNTTDSTIDNEPTDYKTLDEGTFEPRFASFSAFTSGNSRYNTGSYSDVNGYSLLTGLGTRFMFDSGDLILGVFFEYGKASIDSHNSFDAQQSVDSDGNSEYTGGGILARYDHISGLYGEVSARTGIADIDHESNQYVGMAGRNLEYSMSSAYYGAHAGLGFNWGLFEDGNLDINAKYFYTQQEGGNITLEGDAFTFEDTISNRLQAGLKYSHAINEYITPFIGAAWEYEFNGYAKSETQNIAIDAPTLRGGTAIFDAGITFKTNTKIPLSLDIGIEAYTGMRQGVAGKAQFTVAF